MIGALSSKAEKLVGLLGIFCLWRARRLLGVVLASWRSRIFGRRRLRHLSFARKIFEIKDWCAEPCKISNIPTCWRIIKIESYWGDGKDRRFYGHLAIYHHPIQKELCRNWSHDRKFMHSFKQWQSDCSKVCLVGGTVGDFYPKPKKSLGVRRRVASRTMHGWVFHCNHQYERLVNWTI
jgi:hypothetical protein